MKKKVIITLIILVVISSALVAFVPWNHATMESPEKSILPEEFSSEFVKPISDENVMNDAAKKLASEFDVIKAIDLHENSEYEYFAVYGEKDNQPKVTLHKKRDGLDGKLFAGIYCDPAVWEGYCTNYPVTAPCTVGGFGVHCGCYDINNICYEP